MVFVARTGVVRLPAGRDSSAGLMSGILTVFGRKEMTTVELTGVVKLWSVDRAATSRAEKMPTATRRRQSFRHVTKAQDYAIII